MIKEEEDVQSIIKKQNERKKNENNTIDRFGLYSNLYSSHLVFQPSEFQFHPKYLIGTAFFMFL